METGQKIDFRANGTPGCMSRNQVGFLKEALEKADADPSLLSDLEGAGPDNCKLNALRKPPVQGKNALFAGDFHALGEALRINTEAQAALHPSLVSDLAHEVIAVARKHGALGWKVNGAGGDGGSITVLNGSSPSAQRAMLREIESIGGGIRHIPTYLSRFGLRVWETAPDR